jgi:hypothetical protein
MARATHQISLNFRRQIMRQGEKFVLLRDL